MKYKSRIGKLIAKRMVVGMNNELEYLVYNTNFYMDKVTKEIYDSLDLPELKIDMRKNKENGNNKI